MLNQLIEWCAPFLNQHSQIHQRLRLIAKILRSFLPTRQFAKKASIKHRLASAGFTAAPSRSC